MVSYLCNKLKDFENFLSDHVSVQLWSEINEVSLDLCQIIEKGGEIVIPTTLTHGDFQPANIIYCNKEKTFIIDWEYSSRRFEAYDQFVYFFKLGFQMV